MDAIKIFEKGENMLKSNEIYTINENKGVEYLTFNRLLEFPEVKHAYVLKTNDMNFELGPNRVKMTIARANFEKACEAIGLDFKGIARPYQMHTNNVSIVEASFNENVSIEERPDLSGLRFMDTDGLITNLRGVPLATTNADCNLIFMFDPVNKVIANVHAGWRGTFDKIAKNAVIKMKEEFGSNPEDILCFFCPSIRKCHYEVGEEVYARCQEAFEYTGKMDEIASKGDIKEGEQKYYLDLVLPNKLLLLEEGILEENIVDSGICSYCESSKVHSKRAEGDDFSLSAAIIQLN